MDFVCVECGEEFDVFDRWTSNWFAELDEDSEGTSCLCSFYDITCPHCGKKYQVKEYHKYVGAEVNEYQ